MNVQRILVVVFSFLAIIITLAIAVNIKTANAAIESANLTNLIGMTVLSSWGAPIIILGLLSMSGVFAYSGITGKGQASTADIFSVVGATLAAVIVLSFFLNIITYTNQLIGAGTSNGDIIYEIIPVVIYLLIIGGSGWAGIRKIQQIRKGKKGSKSNSVAGY